MRNTKKNILSTLISQLVITVCGILIPRVMIRTFGSEIYGLTTSITQFLSYISLMESGIVFVARAELYAPLANKENLQVSRVYYAIKHFFSIVAFIFLGYTFALSVVYHDIAQVEEIGRQYTFFLIWVMSAGFLLKYLGGLASQTLIYADQKQYVVNIVFTAATVINALLVVLLAKCGCNILIVKIGSSLIYAAQPIGYWIYVKRHYKLPRVGKDRSKLKQKWTGIGQHIAYFLHNNIDVVVLTLFANLELVAVYSVYKLVVSSIRKITGSFTSGMEAGFGEMIAKKEQKLLQTEFRKYKYMLTFVSVVLFGTTAVLIVPFVRLYTADITDANYIQPVFAVVLLLAEAIDCFMHPCSSLPIAANQLKQSKWGPYGEATINIVFSLILVRWDPLAGVAVATLIATIFKAMYYMIFSGKKILQIPLRGLGFNFILTNGLIVLYAFVGHMVLREDMIQNYGQWIGWGFGVFFMIFFVTSLVFFACYPAQQKQIAKAAWNKLRPKKNK